MFTAKSLHSAAFQGDFGKALYLDVYLRNINIMLQL